MKVILILIFVNVVNSQMSFKKWKKAFNGIVNLYSQLLEEQAFDMNSAFINAFNSKFGKTFQLGFNEFSGLTFSDFQKKYLGLIIPSSSKRVSRITYSNWGIFARAVDISQPKKPVPASIDYRNYSLAVQNQKNCGSCWSFSAISTLESKMMLSNSSYRTVLSAQYLVDCDTKNYGCNGGWPGVTLNWIIQSGGNGVPAMTSYQYFGFKTKCRAVTKIPMNITAVVQNYTAGNENMMKEIVANIGPVAAVITVTSYFQSYKSGVFYDSSCNNNCSNLNHAVVIVGYGRNETTNLDYWIVKNSWGTTWGQRGYIFMSRNRENNCNIGCYAMYAI